MNYLYTQLADNLIRRIEQGVYQTGERLPGIRHTSQNEGVSPATAVEAYRELERQGYVEARPRSGFYVRQRAHTSLKEPDTSKPPKQPGPVSGQELVLQLVQDSQRDELVNLATAIPDTSLLPTQAISKTLSALAREQRSRFNRYDFPPGSPELRKELVKRLALAGSIVNPDDIIVTNGCQEALFLSLKTITSPGDIVAVESPVYHGLLQVIDALRLKALEIPTHPRKGLALDALQLALEQWPVKACVVIPNFSNPQGCLMPDENKRALVELIDRYDGVTLIEDDICGELGFDGKRPCSLKSFDNRGNVVTCGSISKTLSPGLRVGWVVSGKYSQSLQYQKFIANSATPTLNQLALAKFFASGRYDRHLRTLRITLVQTANQMMNCISNNFPQETKVTRPAGGITLWLELPAHIDSDVLRERARTEGITIAPGRLFSSTGKYRNYLRLPCAMPWTNRVEKAVIKLADLIKGFPG